MHFHRKLALALFLISLTMAGRASAQTLTPNQGNGLIVRPTQAQATVSVIYRNAQGQPVPGATVTWSLTGSGSLASTQTITDVNGEAINLFTGGPVFGVNFAQSTINASVAGVATNLTVTISGNDPSNIDNTFIQVRLDFPNLGDVLTGSAGSTGATAVRLQVFAAGLSGFQGVPNASVRLVPDGTGGPTIACSGTTGISDINGNVNCLPVFGGSIANGRYFIDVGWGYRQFGSFGFSVTQGQFAAFRITGGNNQSGNPGSALPLQLTARTEDAAGNPLSNVPVVWEAVVPGAVTITNAFSTSDANGNVSAFATLGGTPGTVQVRLRNSAGTISALYNFQVTLAVTGLLRVAGDGQDAVINTTYAQPLIVQVNTTQGPAAGIQVQFNTSGGVLLPNGGVAITDSQGRAQMSVQAGPNPGSAVVTATISNFTVTFNLTLRLPGPQITLNSFFNGAGGQPGGVSPTAVLAIYGGGIAPGLQGCVAANQILGPLPLVLANVSVHFVAPGVDEFAPLYAVCNLGVGQEYVVVQAPATLQPGTTSVIVRVGTGQTTLDNIPVTVVSPGIFETVMSDGKKRAVLLHADGNYVTLQNPAHAGERLRAFVTGLGRPVTRTGVRLGTNQGAPVADDASPQPAIVVGINNEGVRVISTFYAQDLIGVYVVTFEVQSNVPAGADINFAVAAVLNETFVFGNPSKLPIQ